MLIVKDLLPLLARGVLCLATFLFFPILACGESEPGSSTASEPPRRGSTGATDSEREVPNKEPDTIDVAVQVQTDDGEPIVGRTVVLLDARGKTKERLTDEGGLVHFLRIRPPYDVMIAPAPSGIMLVPTIFFGLTRRDPVIELFERDGSPVRPPAETVRVAVAPPPCNAASCFITVATGSTNGSGTTSFSYSGAPAPIVLTVEHEWHVATLPKNEIVDVHVLTGDEGRTTYAYARHAGLTATPGEQRDIGTIAPVPIEATAAVPITTHVAKADVDEAWNRTLLTWLDLPGGGAIALSYREGAEGKGTSLKLPLLPVPGATLRVEAWAVHPPADGTVPFHRSAHARTGERKITTDPIDVNLILGPEMIRPSLDGRISRRGLGFEWTNELPGTFLHQLTVSDLGHGRMRFRVFTNGTSFTLGRLETLGIAKLKTGPHLLDLTTTEGLVADDVTSPDDRQRRRGVDATRSARVTYQRLGFNVMP